MTKQKVRLWVSEGVCDRVSDQTFRLILTKFYRLGFQRKTSVELVNVGNIGLTFSKCRFKYGLLKYLKSDTSLTAYYFESQSQKTKAGKKLHIYDIFIHLQ